VVARGLTVVVIALAGAAGIGGCGDEYSRGAGVYSATTTTATGTTTSATTPAPLQTTDSGGTESSETKRPSAAQRQAVREASAAARRFLEGYLPYSYGRRKADAISSATPALRSTLARNAPRVPPALAAKARPRLVGRPQVSGISGGRVILMARIDDGQSRYVALLTVQRRGSQWLVSQVR
jgi:hypothetical protein